MRTSNVLVGLCAVVLLCVAYRAVSCSLKSDETRVRELVVEFIEAFRDGNRRTIMGSLAKDFEAVWRRRTFSRQEMGDHLAVAFIRGERLILAGEIEELRVGEKSARVVWNGTVSWKHVSGKTPRRIPHTGHGVLEFRKSEGDWLLVRAESDEA